MYMTGLEEVSENSHGERPHQREEVIILKQKYRRRKTEFETLLLPCNEDSSLTTGAMFTTQDTGDTRIMSPPPLNCTIFLNLVVFQEKKTHTNREEEE